ncbi:hypothetical protein [Micromonospora auratinigra]|nr:hypothetical protein [Micromonospora auratinigra]
MRSAPGDLLSLTRPAAPHVARPGRRAGRRDAHPGTARTGSVAG